MIKREGGMGRGMRDGRWRGEGEEGRGWSRWGGEEWGEGEKIRVAMLELTVCKACRWSF